MDKKQTVDFIKGGMTLFGGFGVATIVTNAVHRLSPTNGMGLFMKACTMLGCAMMSGMASHAACEYAGQKIDKIMEVDEETKKPEDDSEKEDTE